MEVSLIYYICNPSFLSFILSTKQTETLNLMLFSTCFLVVKLWSGGNFEEAHYYVKKKVTVNDKKTLRFAARQLAKALPKLALNNS